ncbi:FecR family protein [Fulvivirga sp. M361]|uniref:FecR family protein n=1 Tax=Fulvivirga sp. M361 TaxID=2594266 RepID=UPI001C87E574|nr:FecR domain-containing protein [Fulvivirga sp. M361]
MKILISKLLTETISEEELLELHELLKDPANQKLLETYIQDEHDLNLAIIKNDVDAAYHNVITQIDHEEKPIRKLIPNWTKYAAAVVLLVGLTFIYQQGFFLSPEETTLVPEEDFITLELDNGLVQTINPGATKDIKDAAGNLVGVQNKSQLTYQGTNDSETLLYNTLKVPYGKRFSDGTQVHLNSGTSLRYPVTFLKNMDRKVSIVGEAYFDVTTDAEHPFIVNAGALNVAVLGTQFNLSSYVEDASTDVVLIEGMVGMYNDQEVVEDALTLTPGLKGSFNKSGKTVVTEPVNTRVYTSWRNGELVFRNTPFKNILKKMERHYNVEIVLENEALGEELFSASFTNKTIEMVLSYFDDIQGIGYKIKDNTLYIK